MWGDFTRSILRGSATISLAPSRRRFFMREAKTGWPSVGLAPITRITSDFVDRLEVLRAGRGAERRHQAVAGRRVADAGAGIDVVVAEGGAHQLLDEVGLLVGAARRGDAADRVLPYLAWMRLNSRRGMVDRLVPGHLAPRIRDLRRGSSAW